MTQYPKLITYYSLLIAFPLLIVACTLAAEPTATPTETPTLVPTLTPSPVPTLQEIHRTEHDADSAGN